METTMTSEASESSPGFKELKDAMNTLRSTVTNQLGVHPTPSKDQTPESNKSTTKSENQKSTSVSYELAAQFSLVVETDWEVVPGFILKDILLSMEADLSNDESPTLRVRLEASALIGAFRFLVSAEIPGLQQGSDFDIVFQMVLERPASPDDISKAFQSITGAGKRAQPSYLVDDSLKDVISEEDMHAMLQLRVTKPLNKSLRFNSLLFRFYSQINWRPKLKDSEIGLEVMNGDFILILAKDITDDDAKLEIMARLYGKLLIGDWEIDACAAFQRDAVGVDQIRFELQVLPDVMSAKHLLTNLPTSTNAENPTVMSKGNFISDLDLPSGLQFLQDDFSQPNLRLNLVGSIVDSETESVVLNIHARRFDVFQIPFLNHASLQDLVFMIDLKSWSFLLSGKLLSTRLRAEIQMMFLKGKGIHARGKLLSSSLCSLATLARMDIFNDPSTDQSMDINGYAEIIKTGGNAPIQFSKAAKTISKRVSFDILALNVEKNVSDEVQDSSDQPVVPSIQEKPENSSMQRQQALPSAGDSNKAYSIQKILFTSHFGMDWHIIPNKVVFENLGICFDVRNPQFSNKRTMAGLIYATWRLSKVELFAYVLGKKDAKETEFWAGLTVKKLQDSVDGGEASSKAIDIINDPKFLGSADSKLDLPQLPEDMGAGVFNQTLAEGLEFDGRLLVHFEKKNKEGPYSMKEVNLLVDLKSNFSVSGYKMVGELLVDLRILSPMLKEERDFSCYIRGCLAFESGLYLSFEGHVPMNSKTPKSKPTVQSGLDKEKLDIVERTSEALRMSAFARKSNAKAYLGDFELKEDDIVLLARVSKTPKLESAADQNYEARLTRLQGQGGEQGSDFESFIDVASSSPGKEDHQVSINSLTPEDSPTRQEKYHKGTQFSVTLVLRRQVQEGESRRKIKVLAASFLTTEEWSLIGSSLIIRDVGFKGIIEFSDNRERSLSGILHGTVLFDKIAALEAQITYKEEVLTVAAAVEINLGQLFGTVETSPDERPLLTDQIQDRGDLIAGIKATFKSRKLQGYILKVLWTPEFSITDSLVLHEASFSVEQDRTKAKTHTEMKLTGKLIIDKDTLMLISAVSLSDHLTIYLSLGAIAPAKLAKSLVNGGLDGSSSSSKAELPAQTGFGDWDNENKSGVQTSGTVVFAKGLKFQSANLRAFLTSQKDPWDLVDGCIRLSGFVLSLQIKIDDNKKHISVALTAEFFLTTHRKKDNWPEKASELSISVEKSKLTVSFIPGSDYSLGDLLYCLTVGFIDLPAAFDLPAFPLVELVLDWKSQDASLTAFFDEKEKKWKAPFFGDLIYIRNPSLAGIIKRQGKPPVRVSIKGKLGFLKGLVELEVELVLPDGTLLVEGYDIRQIYDMIKKIFRAVRSAVQGLQVVVAEAGAVVVVVGEAAIDVGAFAIGAAIAALIGVIALGGPAILPAAGWVAGGCLGGVGWLAVKPSIINLLKTFYDGIEDQLRVVKGFQAGISVVEGSAFTPSHENPKVIDLGQDNQSTTVTLGRRMMKDVSRRLLVDQNRFIEVMGSGTCAGLEGSLEEFFLELKYLDGRFATASHVVPRGHSLDFEGQVNFNVSYTPKPGTSVPAESMPVSKIFKNTDMRPGCRYRVPWKRPLRSQTESYCVSLTSSTNGADPPIALAWDVDVTSTRRESLSPDKTLFEIPETLFAGTNDLGYIFLKDAKGNIRQGTDDMDLIQVQINNEVEADLVLLHNSYRINAATPLRIGTYEIRVSIMGTEKVFHTRVIPPRGLDIYGSGLCNGSSSDKGLQVYILDRSDYIQKSDIVNLTLTANDLVTEIPLSSEKSSESILYHGTYDRPSPGNYKLSFLLNGHESRDSHGLPMTIKSIEEPYSFSVRSFQLHSIEPDIPIGSDIPIGDELAITIQVHDQYGSSWKRKEEDPCKDWKLQAEAHWPWGELVKDPPMQLGTLVPDGDGSRARYVVPGVQFTREFNYYLRLVDAQGQVMKMHLEVPVRKRRALTSLIVSGDGLLSGFSNSRGIVAAETFDQYGRPFPVDNSSLAWTVTTSNDVGAEPVSIFYTRKRRFSYHRPTTLGRSLRYFLRIALVTPDATLEALGSPFLLHSADFFSHIDFSTGSFWYKNNADQIQRSEKGSALSTLVLRDQFGSLVPSLSPLVMVESPDYAIDTISYTGSGIFDVSYVVHNPSGSYFYYLTGTLYSRNLPTEVQPTWEPTPYEFLEVANFSIQVSSDEQTLAKISSKAEIHIDELQVIIYGHDILKSSFCCLAKVEASRTEPYTYIISGKISAAGHYTLQPRYRGQALTWIPGSHNITFPAKEKTQNPFNIFDLEDSES